VTGYLEHKTSERAQYSYIIKFYQPCSGTDANSVTKDYDFTQNTGDLNYFYDLSTQLLLACPYYQGTLSTVVTSITPDDSKLTNIPGTWTLSWGTSSGFTVDTTYTVIITGSLQGSNTFTYTTTLTLTVHNFCNALSISAVTALTDTVYIGGVPTGAKSYNYGALTTSPAADCIINFSYIVKNSANVDETSTLGSFITMTPTGDSALRTFTLDVSASTLSSIAAGSPYTITAYAKLKKLMTVVKTDTLTLTVKNSCTQ
jgi:hypothetical protein